MEMLISNYQNYDHVSKIGEGTFGIVYKSKHKTTGKEYALKEMRLESEEEGIPSSAIREVCLLKEINHPNVVSLHEVIHSNKALTLVFELLQRDLRQFVLQQTEGLTEKSVKKLLFQLLKGIEFCHKKKIIHRDLKPQNLLIGDNDILKIGDFGLARSSGIPVKSQTHEVVTLWYRPPDVLLEHKAYGSDIDMWSVGCIFGELIEGKPMFPGKSDSDQLIKIFEIVGSPDLEDYPEIQNLPKWSETLLNQFEKQDYRERLVVLGDDGIDLLNRLLQINPSKRISAKNAVEHKYFNDIREEMKFMYEKK